MADRSWLSVCCLTGGDDAGLTAAILSLYRPIAAEVVVAVDDAAEAAVEPLAAVADRLLTYPFAEPGDRPIPWLFSLCRGPWVLNVDDDEVPSPALLAALPELLARGDLTHGWIARRWLYPDVTTYLDEPPWGREYQLRLLRVDSPLVRFSDEFHRPVVAEGPAVFVEHPLWHLDTAVNSFDSRRRKALRYERERRGMRVASFSHNTGLYLPELRPQAVTRPVPPHDLAAIRSVLEPGSGTANGSPATVERAARADVDRHWPGPPWPETLYDARLTLLEAPPFFVCGVPQTVETRVENHGDRIWRWGTQAVPQIHASYRWHGAAARAQPALRTPLPADVPPGGEAVVPVHVLPPDEPGHYTLEVDLIHEHVRWFGLPARLDVEVRARRRVAVVGAGEDVEWVLDALVELPELEPVLLRPGPAQPQRFGHPELAGLRHYLVGASAPVPRAAALWRAARVLGSVRSRSGGSAQISEFVAGLRGCEALVVAGRDWPSHAPVSRELLRVAVTLAAARILGVRVLQLGSVAPERAGPADGLLGAAVSRLGARVAPERLVEALRSETAAATRRPR